MSKPDRLEASLSTGPEPGARNPMIIWSSYVAYGTDWQNGVRIESVKGFTSHADAEKEARAWLKQFRVPIHDPSRHGRGK